MSTDEQPQLEAELMDFMTPEQRSQAIAEILSTIALRILKKRHEHNESL